MIDLPFTVITLKNTPNSLRGDLTKWMQEIALGVYVGNFNSKIREELWNRVLDSVGVGEATISYQCRNEIGYYFKTHNSNKKVVDFDGIPLIRTESRIKELESEGKLGFSDASKFRKAKKYSKSVPKSGLRTVIFLDIETDGLDAKINNIIEIGAIKTGEKIEKFHCLIKVGEKLPQQIKELTGITEEDLEEGDDLRTAMEGLAYFVQEFDIIGYGVNFDMGFINNKLQLLGMEGLKNNVYDLMNYVKKEKQFLDNYKLQTVLKAYEIEKTVPHRALEDAMLCYELSTKVNRFKKILQKE